ETHCAHARLFEITPTTPREFSRILQIPNQPVTSHLSLVTPALPFTSHFSLFTISTARVVEWQTRTFEGRMPKGMRVQVPPRAIPEVRRQRSQIRDQRGSGD